MRHQIEVLLAAEVLGLQGEVALAVGLRRIVLVDRVRAPERGVAVEPVVGCTVAVAVVFLLVSAGGRERAELQAVVAGEIRADLQPAHADARTVVFGQFAVPVIGEGLLVVALEGFDAGQQIERRRRQPRHLHALVVEAVGAQGELVDQRLVHEIPLVGMLGVQVAEVAEELAAFDLQAEGQARGFDLGHFHFRVVEVDGGDGRGFEVRIHRAR